MQEIILYILISELCINSLSFDSTIRVSCITRCVHCTPYLLMLLLLFFLKNFTIQPELSSTLTFYFYIIHFIWSAQQSQFVVWQFSIPIKLHSNHKYARMWSGIAAGDTCHMIILYTWMDGSCITYLFLLLANDKKTTHMHTHVPQHIHHIHTVHTHTHIHSKQANFNLSVCAFELRSN